MNRVQILDCTLRDGGYINNWNFEQTDIIKTIEGLSNANINIVECGFLDQTVNKNKDSTRFKDIQDLNDVLQNFTKFDKQIYVAMIEYGKYNIEDLPVVDEKNLVKGIRLSFRKIDYKKTLSAMEKIVDKGYKLFVQPISTNTYTEPELIEIINFTNNLNAYALYIVDTQGSMYKEDFRELYYLLDKRLDKSIHIGFHSHNNMQLSYSVAIDFIEISTNREIIIDSSIYGMGRGAGNLNTELLADFINKKVDNFYKIEYILGLIDSNYFFLYKENSWGYSLAHFLSATLKCHPDYASYLLNKKNLVINDIRILLSKIDKKDSREFDKNKIEKLYYNYNNKIVTKINEPTISKNKKVLLIGSGKSILDKLDYVKSNRDNYLIISLNHIPVDFNSDYSFFSSQKRYNEFLDVANLENVIVTSNILSTSKYVLDYKMLSNLGDNINDNSVNMFLNYLVTKGIKNVELLGVDGFSITDNNYGYKEYDVVKDEKAITELNQYILDGLQYMAKKINISFLSNSIFKPQLKQRIICVIPARLSSTRLERKPLVNICGLPMVIHVMKRVMLSNIIDEVYVATDSQEIFDIVKSHNGQAIMTSEKHEDGILRINEVAQQINGDIFVLVNGDEPLVEPAIIEESVNALLMSHDAVAALPITPYTERNNQTNFKVIVNKDDEVMYISRNDIPSDARINNKPMWKALYVVSYKKDFLDIYANQLVNSELDERESTDHLKILEYGYKIQAIKTKSNSISVDISKDLKIVREIMKSDKVYELYKEVKSD